MLAFQILFSTLFSILFNPKAISKVTLVWLVFMIIPAIAFFPIVSSAAQLNELGELGMSHRIALLIAELVLIGILLVGLSVIAVGWHRFVIRGTLPKRFAVWPADWPILGFMWQAFRWAVFMPIMVATTILVIGFVLALFVGLPYSIISGLLSSQDVEIPQIVPQILIWVIGIPVGIPLFVAFSVTPFMFAIVMPAAAVGKKIGLYEARDIAAPIYPQIFLIWICNAVFVGLFGALLYYLIVQVGNATNIFSAILTGIAFLFLLVLFVLYSVGLISELYKALEDRVQKTIAERLPEATA